MVISNMARTLFDLIFMFYNVPHIAVRWRFQNVKISINTKFNKMNKTSNNHNTANDGNMLLSAVVIERQKDGDTLIVIWSEEFQPVMNGVHPDDNFDNTDIIPKKVGRYTFDVTLNGGKDFNGENSEYWSEFLLHNCR